MRVLLDTHTFMFAFDSPQRLSRRAREILENPEIERFVSTLSLAEIAIKIRIGKLVMPTEKRFYFSQLEALNARVLPLDPAHTFEMFHLPLHHRDPFDRMLIAQAKAEGLTLISRDRVLARYGIEVLW